MSIAFHMDDEHPAREPRRVQLSRRPGWRMPSNSVSVARPHRHGNPFRIRRGDDSRIEIVNQTGTVVAYALSMREARTIAVTLHKETATPAIIRAVRAELAGKNLGCFCSLGDPCHADTLLDWANGS